MTPELIGSYHNQIITYIDNNVSVTPDEELTSIDNKCINSFIQFNELNHVGLSNENIRLSYNQCRGTMYTPNNYATLNFSTMYTQYSNGLISIPNVLSLAESNILLTLFTEIENAKMLSREQAYTVLKNAIGSAKLSIDNLGLNYSIHQGFVSRSVIKVAANSLELWYHYDFEGDTPPSLPLWLGMDALGAITGGGASILQDVVNGQPINWKTAGSWALGGAVAGSVPSLRIFKKFFN